MGGAEAMERHEATTHAITPLGRRAAMVVTVLAAFLALSTVLAENAVKTIVTGEVKVVRELTLDKAHAAAQLPHVEDHIAAQETRHSRFETAIVLLQVGIVLTSAAALIGIGRLLLGGAALGLAGAAFFLAGLLA